MRAVDFSLVSTMSTQGVSLLSKVALIQSPLEESSWDDWLMFAEIDVGLMVKSFTTNTIVVVDDTNNEIEYIKMNPLNLE